MQTHIAIDASGLSRFAHKIHPLWSGVLGLVTVEATVVATLIASYFYLWTHSAQWPPAGVPRPDPFWPTVNLALLLASALTMYAAGQGINRGSRLVLVLGTGSSVVLASIVLVLRWQQFQAFGFSWSDHSYGSIVWLLAGFHFLHVASAIVGTAVVVVLGCMGYFTRERQLGVVVDTLYWYFVAGIWVPLYVVIYWLPRLM